MTFPIRAGDQIQLRIWREGDMSGSYRVSPDGIAVFPRLGPTQVTDYTALSLRDSLIRRYSEFLRNPSIEVNVLPRIEILGAVNQPGLYNVDRCVTLTGALALAGGATRDGDQNAVQVRRAGDVLLERLDERTLLADSPIQSGDQLFVPERSWFTRNSGVVAASISAVVSIVIAFALTGN